MVVTDLGHCIRNCARRKSQNLLGCRAFFVLHQWVSTPGEILVRASVHLGGLSLQDLPDRNNWLNLDQLNCGTVSFCLIALVLKVPQRCCGSGPLLVACWPMVFGSYYLRFTMKIKRSAFDFQGKISEMSFIVRIWYRDSALEDPWCCLVFLRFQVSEWPKTFTNHTHIFHNNFRSYLLNPSRVSLRRKWGSRYENSN